MTPSPWKQLWLFTDDALMPLDGLPQPAPLPAAVLERHHAAHLLRLLLEDVLLHDAMADMDIRPEDFTIRAGDSKKLFPLFAGAERPTVANSPLRLC